MGLSFGNFASDMEAEVLPSMWVFEHREAAFGAKEVPWPPAWPQAGTPSAGMASLPGNSGERWQPFQKCHPLGDGFGTTSFLHCGLWEWGPHSAPPHQSAASPSSTLATPTPPSGRQTSGKWQMTGWREEGLVLLLGT